MYVYMRCFYPSIYKDMFVGEGPGRRGVGNRMTASSNNHRGGGYGDWIG